MKQVLLAPQSGSDRPVTLWVDDGTRIGDTFLWRKTPWVVSSIYGTHLSAVGIECRKTDRTHSNVQACVVLDRN